MPIKKNSPEQIIAKLREAEVLLSQGQVTASVCRQIGITVHTYYSGARSMVAFGWTRRSI